MGRTAYSQRLTVLERVLDKTIVSDTGCVIFTGATNREGYGIANVLGRHTRVHRMVFEAFCGPVPEGLVLDHRCRKLRCVNPAHLEPVTTRTNVLRGRGPSALNARKTHCKRGHEYNAENTHHAPDGKRECRPCNRDRMRLRRTVLKLEEAK